MKKFLKRLLQSVRVRDGAIVNRYCGVRRRLRGRTRLLFYGETPDALHHVPADTEKDRAGFGYGNILLLQYVDGDTSGFNRLGADRTGCGR